MGFNSTPPPKSHEEMTFELNQKVKIMKFSGKNSSISQCKVVKRIRLKLIPYIYLRESHMAYVFIFKVKRSTNAICQTKIVRLIEG